MTPSPDDTLRERISRIVNHAIVQSGKDVAPLKVDEDAENAIMALVLADRRERETAARIDELNKLPEGTDSESNDPTGLTEWWKGFNAGENRVMRWYRKWKRQRIAKLRSLDEEHRP